MSNENVTVAAAMKSRWGRTRCSFQHHVCMKCIVTSEARIAPLGEWRPVKKQRIWYKILAVHRLGRTYQLDFIFQCVANIGRIGKTPFQINVMENIWKSEFHPSTKLPQHLPQPQPHPHPQPQPMISCKKWPKWLWIRRSGLTWNKFTSHQLLTV